MASLTAIYNKRKRFVTTLTSMQHLNYSGAFLNGEQVHLANVERLPNGTVTYYSTDYEGVYRVFGVAKPFTVCGVVDYQIHEEY